MFDTLKPAAPDAILMLMGLYRDDPRSDKVDLGVGVYKDAEGHTPVMRAVREAERRLHLRHAPRDRLGRLAAQLEPVADVLGNAHVRPQGIGLEDEGHAPLVRRQARHVAPGDGDSPGGGHHEAGDGPEQGGLAAARGAEQGDELTLGDGEVDAVEHRCRAIGDARLLHLEKRRRCHRAPVAQLCIAERRCPASQVRT